MEAKKNIHVAVNVVTWDSEEYLKDFFESLKKQTFKDFEIIVVDNASKDESLQIAQQYNNVTIIRNSVNLGFSRAHNKGIEMAMKFWEGEDLRERFIFICNPDMILDENCLEEMLKNICREDDIGLAGPRLLRMEIEEMDNMREKKMTNIVDSMGLELLKSRNLVDKFSGAKYEGPLEVQEVFGVSGALMCFRASALESVRWGKEYFDEDFFAYKEDADISWRLKNMDWRTIIVPHAVAYHHRSVRGDFNLSFWKKILSQRQKSEKIKFWSARNHLWMICKNDFFINHLLDWPFIFFSEFGKFMYCLVLDTKVVRAYFSALYGLPKIFAKRAYLKKAKIQPGEMRQWIK